MGKELTNDEIETLLDGLRMLDAIAGVDLEVIRSVLEECGAVKTMAGRMTPDVLAHGAVLFGLHPQTVAAS
jgi:hypothetical protein